MVFKLNNIDFSGHILAGTYEVNAEVQYREFKDGNRQVHRTAYASKVKGSFDMFFKDMGSDYTSFVNAVAAGSLGSQNRTIKCSVNNTGTDKQFSGFVSFKPVRDRRGDWADYMKVFKVSIEEA